MSLLVDSNESACSSLKSLGGTTVALWGVSWLGNNYGMFWPKENMVSLFSVSGERWLRSYGVRDTWRNSCFDPTLIKSSPAYIRSLWSRLTGHRPPVHMSSVRLNTLLIHHLEVSELTTDTQTKDNGNLGVMWASPVRQALAVSVSFLLSRDTAFTEVSSL